jgi:hypothetical protein
MNRVTFPLNPETPPGAAVADLQDALQLFLDRALLLSADAAARADLNEKLKPERANQSYRTITRRLVGRLQQERGLEASGAVDEATASTINKLLQELGLFEPTPAPRFFIVSGAVRREDGLVLQDVRVRAFHDTGDSTIRLGDDSSDAQGQYTIRYEPLPEVAAIQLRVAVIGDEGQTLRSSDIRPNPKPLEIINLTVPVVEPATTQRRIEGQVVLQHGVPAEQLKLRLYRRGFAGAATLLDETITLSGGQYAFSYDPGGKGVSLEVRAVDGANQEVPLSRPLHDISDESRAEIHLVAPSAVQPLAAEYQRLSADLTPHVGALANLAQTKENDERQDLTILNRATGWDTRLIAVAAIAERLSADAEVGLSRDTVYGMLRAGLPSDKVALAQVDPDVVERALRKVRDARVVELSDQQIGQVKQQFVTFANKVRLAIHTPGSQSTYAELLQASGLDAEARDKFAPLYLSHRGDAGQLWDKARQAGLNDAQVHALQLQGKLAFLAGNSEPMTTRLMQKQINDPAGLVDQDFHRADAWKAEARELAGNDPQQLATLIPETYLGSVEERLAAYAEDMSRKVRLSYPTHVVARMIDQDDAGAFRLGAGRDATAKLLKSAAGQGFRLGATSVKSFFSTHVGVGAEMTQSDRQVAEQQTRMLQRVYQMTPTDEAMPVLMSLGITSAYDLTAYSEVSFEDLYRSKYLDIYHHEPASGEAKLVYRKARQVSSVTYNLFTLAKKLDSEPVVHGISAPIEVVESVRNELLKQFPTMESLFGSMDFCECEHCRSVLSPAAYLVDLLQFIDIEAEVWANFLARWAADRNGESYLDKYKNPYDALIERRPDLPHIPLTCENTHTALPYIDIVNEILEYYVAHDKLEEQAVHDTGDATTAELLAEPQNVIREAYDELRVARYPLTLPFDLWIETARQFCNQFEIPLARVLEVLRSSDALFVPTQAFDRSSIFIESLGFSPTDAAVLTAANPLANDDWIALYGYPTAKSAIANPTNVGLATLTLANSDAGVLAAGIVCTYFDVSANARTAEALAISSIGAPNSGGANQTLITLAGVWTAPPDAGDLLVADARASLKSAKTLARRLGVTFKEIVAIVESGFVNPKLDTLGILSKLEVSIHAVRFCRDATNKARYEANKDLLGKTRDELSAADQQRFDALSPSEWEKIQEVQAFERRVQDFLDRFKVQPAQVEAELQAIPLDEILVLADPDAGCDFDKTTLQYASMRVADDIAFLRINLFVRLWRKLGWSIEETDRALQVFVPKNTPIDASHLGAQPLKSALIYLAHLKELDEKLGIRKQGRLKLLTLWSDIATTGKKPLYAQLFLTRNVLRNDDVFDHPLGQYLSGAAIAALAQSRTYSVVIENVAPADRIDPAPFAGQPKVTLTYDALAQAQHLSFQGVLTEPEETALAALSPSQLLPKLLKAVRAKGEQFSLLKGHLLALQGALSLTAVEIAAILEDVGKSLETAQLSLPHVSLLYRYGLLAKALKLPVSDLIALKQLSGRDPFRSIHADPLTALTDDHPFMQTLRFVGIAEAVKDSGFKVEDLDYLLRHRFDETGTYRPNREGTLALLRIVGQGIRAIRAQHAVPDDPSTISDDVLRQELGLALPAEIVERLFAMLSGTVEFTATKSGVLPAARLAPEGFADEAAFRDVRYKNSTRQEQKITFRGVLVDAEKNALLARLPKPLPTNPHVPSLLLGELLEDVKEQARSFFEKYLLRQPPGAQPGGGFLEAGDFGLLFDRSLPLAAGETEQDRIRSRRAKLARAFLPFLQERLIRQFVTETMTAESGAEPNLVESLLTDERLLAAPGTLLDALVSSAARGISASFFDSNDCSGVRQATAPIVLSVDTTLKDAKDSNGNVLGSANSARFDGYLEVPTAGAYRFYLALDRAGAQVALRFDHLADPTFWSGTAAADGDILGGEPEQFIELKPGIAYRFHVELHNLNGGNARLSVQGETLPKDTLAQLALSPLAAIDAAERAVALLTKAIQLLLSLGLNERETRYLLTHASDFDNLSLNDLPTQRIGDAPADVAAAAQRFKQFLRLADYTRLKRDLAAATDDLIAIFEVNGTKDLDRTYTLIAKLTRRDEAIVRSSSNAIFTAPSFASEQPLQRLWEVLQVVERFSVPVASLLEWTRIVDPTVTPERRFGIARDLKEAIKSRFEPETWQRVAQPIFDRLRQKQRDALVAHVMQKHGFARMEQLYEYFLIDPGMEPVVQTSRIRLAISSLQLFVQRCLLNLEKNVRPSAIINAGHWEWMKRYRVWEANRKIFLFPENWLEPEFRDDKTPQFNELEGALLQGDVSSDLVEDAFLTYLGKLDEIARLDILAMHLEDTTDAANNTLHVIGRTHSQPHKYFYRRYTHQTWTAWESVTAEIEGDHLAPVIWRDRLYLFWVTFTEKAEAPKASGTSAVAAAARVEAGGNSLIKKKAGKKGGFKKKESALVDMTLSEVTTAILSAGGTQTIEVQLHWSAHLNGEWSTRESTGFDTPIVKTGLSNFNRKSVFVHVSVERQGDEEGGVYVHLGGSVSAAFFLAGRNSTPEPAGYTVNGPPGLVPKNCYNTNGTLPTRYEGSSPLSVEFNQVISNESGKTPTVASQPILKLARGAFTLLPCDNNFTLAAGDEIASLMKPVFYQDNRYTLFIEPSVTEQTIEEWQEWVSPPPPPEVVWKDPHWFDDLVVIADLPKRKIPFPEGPDSLINPNPTFDWLINPATTLVFDSVLIGAAGQPGLEIVTAETLVGLGNSGTLVNVNPGSSVAPGTAVIARGITTMAESGLAQVAGGLNVVGAGGFNATLAENFNKANETGFGAKISGAGGSGL